MLRSTLAAAFLCGAALPASAQSAADLSYRLSTLEEQIRQLNGQVETLNHRVRQLEQQLSAGGGSSATYNSGSDRGAPPMDMSGEYGVGGNNIAGPGAPPAILGQVPATGPNLDLSGAFEGPSPVQQGADGSVSIQEGGGRYGGADAGGQQAFLPPGGTPQDDYDTAYGYILRGEFAPAQQAFGAFLQRHPDDELAGNAQYWLGEALFATGRYREAADAFLAGYTEYPRSAKAPDSLYKLGMSLKELGQADAACATFSEISRTFPNAPQAVLERTRSEMERSGC
ncbi:tol-pal system protein YbgF [Lutibaculum baratangense]|uniref:Cell division coordinator CpoB n=1 Tax=Lutibaculum baratangense AMV1 TaxID=631454 RepID=V4R2J3_9HYPH|nr:tol-pal system protein YbgF [Lutibaculum baratangense]ESR26172.1 TPR repeat containing exported protein [Lutibaculum baratangense AMV1]